MIVRDRAHLEERLRCSPIASAGMRLHVDTQYQESPRATSFESATTGHVDLTLIPVLFGLPDHPDLMRAPISIIGSLVGSCERRAKILATRSSAFH